MIETFFDFVNTNPPPFPKKKQDRIFYIMPRHIFHKSIKKMKKILDILKPIYYILITGARDTLPSDLI
jgi:hypothetical protein